MLLAPTLFFVGRVDTVRITRLFYVLIELILVIEFFIFVRGFDFGWLCRLNQLRRSRTWLLHRLFGLFRHCQVSLFNRFYRLP